MSTFEVQKICDFETLQPVNKLIRNGKCMFDAFVKAAKSEEKLEAELGELYAIIQYVASRKTPYLPKQKFRKLHLKKKLKYTGFEAKSKHLRLYLFMEKETGIILVFGGKKGTQEQTDLELFEKIIKDYTQFKK